MLDPTKTVRELAVEIPGATRLFEKLKIDYCCGGNRRFDEACQQAGVKVETISQWLEAADTALPQDSQEAQTRNVQSLPLAELSEYIVNKHHVFTRNEMQRLTELFGKVCSKHGTNHPELVEMQSEFQTLCSELGPHMMKEENILFPYIARLETAVQQNGPVPFAPFGTVQNPIAVMMKEHDAAGEILKRMRGLANDFNAPEDACISYQTLYAPLAEIEADLHQHIHLENNILFPKALEMENKTQAVMV